MSTFSQFTGGNRIKSIQRGTITIPVNTKSATATIASVNTAKTELRMLGFTNNGQISGGIFPKISLTSSTTITATRGGDSTSYGTTTVSWELTEFI